MKTMSEEKTRLLYEVSCAGYRGETQDSVPAHKWYRYEKPYPRSSYTCPDCAVLFQKDLEQAKKTLEGKIL